MKKSFKNAMLILIITSVVGTGLVYLLELAFGAEKVFAGAALFTFFAAIVCLPYLVVKKGVR